jgi:hypothetical protein
MSSPANRRERIGRIVSAVIRQAVTDARADGVLLPAAPSPESGLAREWCELAVGPARVFTADSPGRLLAAHAASKTTLLLTPVPPVALLPLGDLYGSEVLELGGDWSPPRAVRELAAAVGGAEVLDRALRRWAEERHVPAVAFQELPPALAGELERLLLVSRFARWTGGLVPKLTSRTVGIDLWE